MDLDLIAERLSKYLDSCNDSWESHRVTDVSEINMGWETELFVFRSFYVEDGAHKSRDLVLRVYSGENAAAKVVKEFNLMKRLKMVDYPVPHVYCFDQSGDVLGKPFLIMERIRGQTLNATYQNKPEALQEYASQLMKLLVRLHTLNTSRFKESPGLKTMRVQEYVNTLQNMCDEYTPWLNPIVDWLYEHMPRDSHGLSLCHMDFHGMNILLDMENQPYVIDWGSSLISDPRLDLAWTLLLYNVFGGDVPYRALLDAYRSLVGETEYLWFFEITAALRRIVDLAETISGGASSGLKLGALDLMRASRDSYYRVQGFIEARTGIRVQELDDLLSSLG